jgi:hypothetical protein
MHEATISYDPEEFAPLGGQVNPVATGSWTLAALQQVHERLHNSSRSLIPMWGQSQHCSTHVSVFGTSSRNQLLDRPRLFCNMQQHFDREESHGLPVASAQRSQ